MVKCLIDYTKRFNILNGNFARLSMNRIACAILLLTISLIITSWFSGSVHSQHVAAQSGGMQPTALVGQYQVTLNPIPAVIKPGKKVTLNFTILPPKTGDRVANFNVVPDKVFHLFIVSQDLEYFEHILPIRQPDGAFSVETTLPRAGPYNAYFEFTPAGATRQVIRRTLVADGPIETPAVNAVIEPDRELTKSVDGIRFKLTTNPSEIINAKVTHLEFHLVHDTTDWPITDLQPYLGAWGHTFILSEDMTDSLHVRPETMIPEDVDRSKLSSGGDISFETFFRRPGRYRIWSQFQRQEKKLTTVSFTVNVVQLDKVAKWDGRSWAGLPGTSSAELKRTVHTIAAAETDVYVGGDFTSIGGVSANRVARWDGRRWSSLGDGIDNGVVYAIAVKGSDVYVGGSFTSASGISVNRIARWNGRAWSSPGSGVGGCGDRYCAPTVYSLLVKDGDLYVGGQFSRAGEVPANAIAKWNGNQWFSLGAGMRAGSRDGVVRALAKRGSTLFVGGTFITADQVRANNIARWDGTKWSSMGHGVRGRMDNVRSIGVSDSDVYVGGSFSIAGEESVHNIAKWNGSKWSSLEIEPEDVYAIAVSEREIYVGANSFVVPGEASAQGVVKWDGKSWSNLGKGIVLAPVLALHQGTQGLFIGGG